MTFNESKELTAIREAVQVLVNRINEEADDDTAVLINCVFVYESLSTEDEYEINYVVPTAGTSPATSVGLLKLGIGQIERHILD